MHLPTRLLQYPVAKLENGAVLLGQVNELLGGHVAEGWMGPANQGLGAHQALGLEAELGLVAQAQLVALDGAAQFVLQGNALAGLGGQFASVGLDPVAALGFGAVHGGVGVADQVGDIGAVLWV